MSTRNYTEVRKSFKRLNDSSKQGIKISLVKWFKEAGLSQKLPTEAIKIGLVKKIGPKKYKVMYEPSNQTIDYLYDAINKREKERKRELEAEGEEIRKYLENFEKQRKLNKSPDLPIKETTVKIKNAINDQIEGIKQQLLSPSDNYEKKFIIIREHIEKIFDSLIIIDGLIK